MMNTIAVSPTACAGFASTFPARPNWSRCIETFVPIALCLVLCGIGQQRLYAGQYRFTTIADSSDPRFSSFEFNGTPVVNNSGVVAFGATLTDGTSGIFTGSGGELTTLVDTSGQFDNIWHVPYFRSEISINSAGTVAFVATLDTDLYGVYTVDAAGTITTIADSTGDFFEDFRGVSINDAGAVAFYARRCEDPEVFSPDHYLGIYVGQGGPLATIVEADPLNPDDVRPLSQYQQPNINNNGEVAFFGQYGENQGIFVGDGISLTRIVDTEGAINRFIPEARCPINDAGTVAFLAESDVDGVPYHGVRTYSDGTITEVVETGGFYQTGSADFCDVMINNEGTLAFGGLSWSVDFPSGIYTGADPEADKVIAVGDLLDGSPLVRPRFYGQGLNDRGQIAFYAETEAGTGIYLATPVPEPAGLLLILSAAPLILWRRAAPVTLIP
jgi:hypothetical protein